MPEVEIYKGYQIFLKDCGFEKSMRVYKPDNKKTEDKINWEFVYDTTFKTDEKYLLNQKKAISSCRRFISKLLKEKVKA